jgi:hypothetical protein
VKVADHGLPTTMVPAGNSARNSPSDMIRVNSVLVCRHAGLQCLKMVAVCGSTGNHRFGVVMTQWRATLTL